MCHNRFVEYLLHSAGLHVFIHIYLYRRDTWIILDQKTSSQINIIWESPLLITFPAFLPPLSSPSILDPGGKMLRVATKMGTSGESSSIWHTFSSCHCRLVQHTITSSTSQLLWLGRKKKWNHPTKCCCSCWTYYAAWGRSNSDCDGSGPTQKKKT